MRSDAEQDLPNRIAAGLGIILGLWAFVVTVQLFT